jgi:two-component sensor histidine kinase
LCGRIRALAQAHKLVSIAWSEEDCGDAWRFVLRWSETGGPKPDPAPMRQGFGAELIEREVRHDLGGTVKMTFGEEGLVAVLSLPRPRPRRNREARIGPERSLRCRGR